MKNLILITLSILFLASCSPQRRLHRLVTKHPELSRIDTIKIQDTVIVPGVKTDTLFHSSALKDTITITKEKLQIRLIEINDTIYLNAKVEPDTVILTKEIIVDRIIYTEPQKWFSKYLKAGLLWLIVFIFIFFLFIFRK